METPNTIEGFLTEAIMVTISARIGKMPTHNYNAIYSAVLDTLNRHLPEIRATGAGVTREEYARRGFC